MARTSSILIIFLVNCTLIYFAFGLVGENVKIVKSGDYSFVVSLQKKLPFNITGFFNQHFCTGSLITHRSVLTAEHCLLHKNLSQVEVIAGSTNVRRGKHYEIQSWTTFNEWNHHNRTKYPLNDIAIVILEGEGLTHIRPVPVMLVDNNYLVDQDVRILGWGTFENGRRPQGLRAAYLKVVSNEECSNQGTMLKGKKFTVPPNYFCSRAKPWVVSSCGDGGAPVLNKKRRLVGINIGICPYVDGYPVAMLNQLVMNSHLHLHFYRDFLTHVML